MSTYTVKNGDTLSSIAGKFYGDITLWPMLAEVNNISNADVIYPGKVLQIPDVLPQVQVTAKRINPLMGLLVGLGLAGGVFLYVRNKKKKKQQKKVKA